MRWLLLGAMVLLSSACTEPTDTQVTAPKISSGTRVVITRPQQRSIDYVLTALGSVESIQHPTISAETSGQIVSIGVSEGESITAQQLLATIDSTLHGIEADKALAELQRQEVLLDNQQREVNRLQHLSRSQSISKDRLEDEQAQLEMLTALRNVARKQREQALYLESKARVLAPQSGLVAKRYISVGDYVSPGQALFDLVSVDRLRARLAFPEHHAANISVGKQVRLQAPVAQERAATGAVTSINPQINPRSRAIDVIVEFDNPGEWLPGGSVDAVLVMGRNKNALTLPVLSVVRRAGNDVVFVIDGDMARQRPVKLGWREDNWVEVLEGVSAQEQVVTEGSASIRDGSRIIISGDSAAP